MGATPPDLLDILESPICLASARLRLSLRLMLVFCILLPMLLLLPPTELEFSVLPTTDPSTTQLSLIEDSAIELAMDLDWDILVCIKSDFSIYHSAIKNNPYVISIIG